MRKLQTSRVQSLNSSLWSSVSNAVHELGPLPSPRSLALFGQSWLVSSHNTAQTIQSDSYFNREDGGNMFLLNGGISLYVHTALQRISEALVSSSL
jgi:hypothetical protein